MGATSTLPDAVQWSEGMLLSPQHLQQNDIYWHEHLRHRLSCITPHYWGVSKLAIDRSALIGGMVTLTELECVLPDGETIQYALGPSTLSIPIAGLFNGDNRPVRIWLRVRERGGAAAKMANPERRFNSLPGEMTSDENTGDGDIQVGRLQTCFALFANKAGDPPPSARCACPLLEVSRDGQGHMHIADYHPPMLQVEASAFQEANSLQRQLGDLLQKLWTKTDELAGKRNDDKPEDEAAPGSQRDLHLRAARHLATVLPQLEIAAMAQGAHPNDLYRALALVVGQVACIGTNPIPPKMSAYKHEDCMPQFRAAFAYIEAKLALINTDFDYLQFARLGETGFARRLPPDLGNDVIIELKPRDGQSLANMTNWINDASIASDNLIPLIQQRRLPGALCRPLNAAEIAKRNLRPQAALFILQNQKITVDGKGLQDVFQANQSLLIQGAANANMPASIVLYRQKQALLDTPPDPLKQVDTLDAGHA